MALTNIPMRGFTWKHTNYNIGHPSDLKVEFHRLTSTAPVRERGGAYGSWFQTPLASECHLGAQAFVFRSMFSIQEQQTRDAWGGSKIMMKIVQRMSSFSTAGAQLRVYTHCSQVHKSKWPQSLSLIQNYIFIFHFKILLSWVLLDQDPFTSAS